VFYFYSSYGAIMMRTTAQRIGAVVGAILVTISVPIVDRVMERLVAERADTVVAEINTGPGMEDMYRGLVMDLSDKNDSLVVKLHDCLEER
jgi:hypothetical protein